MKKKVKLTKFNPPGHAQPRRRHNAPLMESILLSLTIFLSFSLLVIMTINFAKDYLSSLHLFPMKDNTWEHVHYRGDVSVTQKKEDDSLPYNTFRFKFYTDVPFDTLVSTLNDPTQVQEWFAWSVNPFKDNEAISLNNEDVSINRIFMNVPYLHRHNRELVFRVNNEISTTADEKERDKGKKSQIKKAIYTYKDEESLPLLCENCKRGKIDINMIIRAKEDDMDHSSDIEMILYMDLNPNNMIPSFIMNRLTKEWGIISLNKLRKICKTSLGVGDIPETKFSLYNVFPLKR